MKMYFICPSPTGNGISQGFVEVHDMGDFLQFPTYGPCPVCSISKEIYTGKPLAVRKTYVGEDKDEVIGAFVAAVVEQKDELELNLTRLNRQIREAVEAIDKEGIKSSFEGE